MAGGIGVIIAIIFIIRYLRTHGQTPDRTNPPTGSKGLMVWMLYLFLSACLFAVITQGDPSSSLRESISLIVMLVASVILFPSLFAQASIYLGWVKVSYWLGRIAYNRHQKDLFAGALFFGWRAAHHAKGDKKSQGHEWLAHRLNNYRGTLGSGTMLVHAMMKAEPLAYKDLRAQFIWLQGINKNWLPENIARAAFRFILARACREEDFPEIRAQARYWQLVCKNRFAQWVDMYHWSLGADVIPRMLKLKITWLYFWVGNGQLRNFLPHLFKQSTAPTTSLMNLAQLKEAELNLFQSGAKNSQWINDAWRSYSAGPMADEWLPRIKALGSFNENEVLSRLQQSVLDLISLRSGEGDLDSEAAMAERDNGFKLLQIKIAAMVNRSEQNKMMTGIQEYEEFLALLRVAERLGKDDHSRAQVFFQMRSPVWNWMVELWNNTKNRPLAFLAGNYMAPLAREFGDTDAYEFFSGIVGHKYT